MLPANDLHNNSIRGVNRANVDQLCISNTNPGKTDKLGFPPECGDMNPREDNVQVERETKRRKKSSVKLINWEAILEEELRKYSIDFHEHTGVTNHSHFITIVSIILKSKLNVQNCNHQGKVLNILWGVSACWIINDLVALHWCVDSYFQWSANTLYGNFHTSQKGATPALYLYFHLLSIKL